MFITFQAFGRGAARAGESLYPKNWVFVRTHEDAERFMQGLVDTPWDIIRLASGKSRKELETALGKWYPVSERERERVMQVLRTGMTAEEYALVEKFPPYFAVVPREVFDAAGRSGGKKGDNVITRNAAHVEFGSTFLEIMAGAKSNVFFIAEDSYLRLQKNPQELTSLLVHETHHYAAGVARMNYTKQTRTIAEKFPNALNEGATEYYACKAMKAAGNLPGRKDVYPIETRVALFIERAVGEQVLRQAYHTGDFWLAERKIDKAGGRGTWKMLTREFKDYDADWKARKQKIKELAKTLNIDLERLNKEAAQLGK